MGDLLTIEVLFFIILAKIFVLSAISTLGSANPSYGYFLPSSFYLHLIP